ncbi:MAG: hypothetical protein DMG55_18050 [Acidobacteria bacterium]|nr:MAG: hypothetical protein DMG55_18050 [Acidobacteriota bacterium]
MKWWTHDSDLHNSPAMQEIIAELGLAGYGRANVLLETLAKYADHDGQFVFQMPLARPTDIKFWSREFRQSAEEVEHTFDIFEQAALIQPWREPKTICAPMLGARVDEWTKRKNKARSPKSRKALGNGQQQENGQENEQENEDEHQHQHNITPEPLGSCSGVPKPAVAVVDVHPSSQTRTQDKAAKELTDGEIIAEYVKTANGAGYLLETTEAHRKAGIAFFKKHGRDVALAAWSCFLRNTPHQVQLADGKKEYRTWRLKDFLDSGKAEVYADSVRPIVERGVTSSEGVELLRTDGNFSELFDGLLESDPIIAQRVVSYLNRCENADKEDVAYLNSDSPTLFDYVVQSVQAKSAQVKCEKEDLSEKTGQDDAHDNSQTPDADTENEIVKRVWDNYIEKLGKNPKLLSLTALRKEKGEARLREALQKTGDDLVKAEKLLLLCVDALASSAFHRGDNDRKTAYDSWEQHLFKSQEQFETWLERT